MSARRLIWVLQGSRAGDNAQARELASRLGGEVVLKELTFNALQHAPNWALGRSLASLTPAARRMIAPPWPDLVIAIGKRTVSVAKWIKSASDGKARLVHLGRPRARLEDFDLVISTPQYGLPRAPNLIEMDLPFAVAKTLAAGELERWRAEWRELPRPLIAVVIGSGRFPLSLPQDALTRLGRQASGMAAQAGGALLVIMSPRSEADAHGRVGAQLSVPQRCYPWTPGGENPYQAALAFADRFIVTSDSASMISEALSTGKPVSLFPLPVSPLHVTWDGRRGFAAWLARNGLLQPPRDITRISRNLLQGGYVSALGREPSPARPFHRNDDEVLARIEAILETPADQKSLASRNAS
jgi:uncharacterized protein